MDRPELIRRLRIAASAFFAVVTVALCVLWVRSYWWNDLVLCTVDKVYILVESQPGAFGFSVIPEESVDPWIIYSQPASEWRAREKAWRQRSWGNFYIGNTYGPVVVAPYWFWVLISATFAATPWRIRSNRFSLRTLLIATTLVAVVLGLGVWAAG